MQYRKFCNDDPPVSILGFGSMRLPLNSQDPGDVDVPQSIAMIRLAVDRGVNYIDTAYGYHNGRSESVVGQALRDGYRNKVRLATKMPHWLVNSAADMERIFDEQLSRLGTERIDCYLLHALNDEAWQKLNRLNVLAWAEQRMKSGQIGRLGFSFHDAPEVFMKIVDQYSWDFCQIQYNYMDIGYQAGTLGLEYASGKNIPILVMEPLRGGALADPPQEIRKIFADFIPERTPAEWTLLWGWSQPGVSSLLSGMSSLSQVADNLDAADHATAMSDRELAAVARVRAAFLERQSVECTRCGYCLPCPYGVDIPLNFTLFNEAERFNSYAGPRWHYANRLQESQRAGFCTHCRRCLEKCPQHLDIPGLLEKVHRSLKNEG